MEWVPNKPINMDRVNSLLNVCSQNRQFTNYGANVADLETIIKDRLQIDDNKAIIAVANGSCAIQVLATGVSLYNEIEIKWATQSFTFPSSAQGTLMNTEIVDIDEEGGIDLEEISKNVDGIIVTNVFGNVVNIGKYEKWSRDNSKFLIFDNAATPFTFYKGKSSCNYGIGSTISFHHTKPLGFGEGGAVIVDRQYERVIRGLVNFGYFINDVEAPSPYSKYGNNYKMSEISAIYIIQYLDNFDNIVNHHISLYNYFKKQIEILKLPIKLFPSFHDKNKIVPACFCLLFDEYDDNIRVKLLNQNIFCKKYYIPLKKTRIATKFYNRILCLPCSIDISITNIDYLIKVCCKLN